jgi:hypothetical protein
VDPTTGTSGQGSDGTTDQQAELEQLRADLEDQKRRNSGLMSQYQNLLRAQGAQTANATGGNAVTQQTSEPVTPAQPAPPAAPANDPLGGMDIREAVAFLVNREVNREVTSARATVLEKHQVPESFHQFVTGDTPEAMEQSAQAIIAGLEAQGIQVGQAQPPVAGGNPTPTGAGRERYSELMLQLQQQRESGALNYERGFAATMELKRRLAAGEIDP